MSRNSRNRDTMTSRLEGVADAGLRLSLLMKSPFRKHRRKAAAMGETVAKMQDLVETNRRGDPTWSPAAITPPTAEEATYSVQV